MWKKDGKPWDGKSVIVDGMRYFSPKDDILKKAGYAWEEPKVIPPPDRTQEKAEFAQASAKFREVCAEIGELIGNPEFKGGFDEMAEFEASAAAQTEAGVALAIKWMAADKLCTYLGSKIGLHQPRWWHECWKQQETE